MKSNRRYIVITIILMITLGMSYALVLSGYAQVCATNDCSAGAGKCENATPAGLGTQCHSWCEEGSPGGCDGSAGCGGPDCHEETCDWKCGGNKYMYVGVDKSRSFFINEIPRSISFSETGEPCNPPSCPDKDVCCGWCCTEYSQDAKGRCTVCTGEWVKQQVPCGTQNDCSIDTKTSYIPFSVDGSWNQAACGDSDQIPTTVTCACEVSSWQKGDCITLECCNGDIRQ